MTEGSEVTTASQGTITPMRLGTVMQFDSTRGFGFIEYLNGRGIFVHWSNIVMDGFRALLVGAAVEFRVSQDPKGRRQAVDVRPF